MERQCLDEAGTLHLEALFDLPISVRSIVTSDYSPELLSVSCATVARCSPAAWLRVVWHGCYAPTSRIEERLWDLVMKDRTRIEVRSGSRIFSLKGRKDVQVWVFVQTTDPWRYFVASDRLVRRLRRHPLSSVSRLSSRESPQRAER